MSSNEILMNEYPFLCTMIVVDEFGGLLLEKSFITHVSAGTEEEGKKQIEKVFGNIERSCVARSNNNFFLHVHCLFPMEHDVRLQELSQDWLFSSFKELSTYVCKK